MPKSSTRKIERPSGEKNPSSLSEYRRKRRFDKTPEPEPQPAESAPGNRFVVQKHDATRLHYDFRLEIGGALKSWAVPKGPSLNPADKRLAVETEDHPLDYAGFEGVIPEGNYGAGPVIVWDHGTFSPEGSTPALEQYERGELKFVLHGKKLRGGFVLVKIRGRDQKGKPWLLIKHRDAATDPAWNIDEHGGSVISGRGLKEVEEGLPAVQPSATVALGDSGGARKAKMPASLQPMLATLVDKPFSDPNWVFEIKWDGVRSLAWIRNGRLELHSRKRRVITAQYPELASLPDRIRAKQAILDGEIVTLDEKGISNFERLQSRINVQTPSEYLQKTVPVVYYLFDLLYCDGYDLRKTPLLERKRRLKDLLDQDGRFIYADHQAAKGREMFEAARERGLEGIVGKEIHSPYTETRSSDWVKFKITREVDVVIGGYTAPRGSREYFGALLVGLYDRKILRFAGGVGTGFDHKMQRTVYDQLKKITTGECPFSPKPETREKAQWVKPKLVARLKYANWTDERRLRAPVFLTLLEDHKPSDCQFKTETPAATSEVLKNTKDKAARSGEGKHPKLRVEPALRPAPNVLSRATSDRPLAPLGERVARVASRVRGSRENPTAKDYKGRRAKAARPAERRQRGTSGAGVAPPSKSGLLKLEAALLGGHEESVSVELDGKPLQLTHLNKVYFPESGYTKRDLLAYYYTAARYILPFLKDRPLVLRRYPDGIRGESFFQKDAGKYAQEWMETVAVHSQDEEKETHYFIANDLASLLYLTNLGCIDHNPWASRRDDLDRPDYIFFDLDPSEGTEFAVVLRIARAVHQKLLDLGMTVFLKTSGATGFHLYVPLKRNYTFDQVRMFAEAIGRAVANENPKQVTGQRIISKRPRGTVMIDAYQNSLGRPLAAPYAVRAFPGAPVSTPVSEQELKKGVHPERLNLKTIFRRLDERGDLWADFWKSPQRLEDVVNKAQSMV